MKGGLWGRVRGFNGHTRSCTTPIKLARLHISPMGPETGLNLPAQRATQRPNGNGNFKTNSIIKYNKMLFRLYLVSRARELSFVIRASRRQSKVSTGAPEDAPRCHALPGAITSGVTGTSQALCCEYHNNIK